MFSGKGPRIRRRAVRRLRFWGVGGSDEDMPATDQTCRSTGGAAVAVVAPSRWRFDPVEWEATRADPAAARWLILHTRSRQEKAVAEILASHDVEVFLPLIRKVRYYGHRRRAVELPLFPSYVFAWAPPEAAYPVIASKRAVGTIRAGDQERLDRELLHLRLAVQGDADLDPYPFLDRGRSVRVTAGPFRGVEGVVDERRGHDRLILQIHTLGRATALEIDPSLLEPLD